jgi:hypothetical protein
MIHPSIFKSILIIVITGFICVVVQTVVAQNNEQVKTSDKSDSIRNTESLYYYGVDFSHIRISDSLKVSRSAEYSKVYPRAWIAYLEKEIMRTHWVQRSLRKRTFYYKQNEIISVSVKVVNDFIIAEPYSFPLDTVKYAIKQYNLNEKAGIGLVLIPENFNKQQEHARMWVVFFDIQNREILWATEVTGRCQHMGYTAHWGSGIIDGFKYFIRKTYRKPLFPAYDNY